MALTKPTAPAKRVLVVEDGLIALVMAEQLVEFGYIVAGPAFTISEARHLATAAPIDAALLDVNLGGILGDEIADILSRRQIPFVFVTGYNGPPMTGYKNADVLHKPFALADLRYAVEAMLVQPVDRDATAERRGS